jgi:hypothetical protein
MRVAEDGSARPDADALQPKALAVRHPTAIPLLTWVQVTSDDRLGQALAGLTPASRQAVELSLLGAIGQSGSEEPPLGAELVNVDPELVGMPVSEERLRELVQRADREGAQAPIVRLGEEGEFALLVSRRHVWDLVDRVDELQAALDALAIACAQGPHGSDRIHELSIIFSP